MNGTSLRSVAHSCCSVASVARWVDKAIVGSFTLLAVGSLGFMFIALLTEVVVRYATKQGMGWPSEVPNILFPWLVMSGIVLAAQAGQHVAVTALLSALGSAAARVLLLALQALIAVTFCYLAWSGLDVLEITGGEVYPVTGVTARWAYLALVVGFSALSVTAISTFVQLLLADDPKAVRAPSAEERA